ncbi:hypothetical protein BIV25_00375 [Streptomyces sp. MUSC 14]|uniref:hypothetical protein n=1 Tax=Streptomyces sp. MUSC 14 TaxID=1354889 RepID=UPI0008F56EA7|nr:hypothetical protein [Streptomyces sp. MUSC 14]OIK02970.1 hypothetical protein BIV25_00375 [Streptomyces sp. MUSC 14]
MADEHDKWLNRETAERLLRGESLEVVDARARDQAERLSRALGALSAQGAAATGELPGEQAALAAFRKAREAAEAERTAAALAEGAFGERSGSPAPPSDAGLIRIGAPARTARTGIPGGRPRRRRWARPVRLALAAGVSAGMLGGVAMAVGSGVLPTFGTERPGPAASVSAGQSSASPLASVAPSAPVSPGPGVPSGAGTSPGATPGAGTGPGPGASPGAPSGAPDGSGQDLAGVCRAIRDGKAPDPGRMRMLEDLAGGSSRVDRFCKLLLGAVGSGLGGDAGDPGKHLGKGKGNGGGQGKGGDGAGQGDDGGHPGGGDHGGDRSGQGGGHGQGGDGGSGGDQGNGGGSHGDAAPASP